MTPNPRGKWERDTDAATPWEAAARFANDHGPVALIAVASFALLAWLLVARLDAMASMLNAHVRDTSWYQRQTCISVAVMAGTPKELCDPPRDSELPR